jgi:alkanesulfonate monooxygenase SsuD/methylene tetrahydromethanopterin reductase-like flavin-dependent oxidoreductase (luciferase family)
MSEIGIMIEGQEGLTWERLFRLAGAAEDLGFAHLFRSDHLVSFSARRTALALWPSLAALAVRTERIRFGPMVCSMTFRQPAMVAKMAASTDALSGGRFDLGLGAGWFKAEHRMFGIDFPPYRTRLEMLDEGAQIVKALWSGEPADFQGVHYSLEAAESLPLPLQPSPTLIMGGKGKKTLAIVARLATEWNFSYAGLESFRLKSAELDQNCLAIGRDPATLRRSLMIPFVIGRDAAAVQGRIDAHRRMFSALPETLSDWLAAGYLGGSPEQLAEQMNAFAEAGIERFMLQHNDLDDLDSLEMMAADVLPHFH